MTTPSIFDLIGQHPILVTLAGLLSTVDLLHLGLTSRYCHALVLSSHELFELLKRQCLCDGRGLRRRLKLHLEGKSQAGEPLRLGHGVVHDEEEVEVRLFARKCDEADALPCRRCGINICDECRECPRTLPAEGGVFQLLRPVLSVLQDDFNSMYQCRDCDVAMEDELSGQFLSSRCDCSILRRWICRKCAEAERRETWEYYDHHTSTVDADNWHNHVRSTQYAQYGDHYRVFFCIWGSTVPNDMVARCTWCKRRHVPEEELEAEVDNICDNDFLPAHVTDGGSLTYYYLSAFPMGTAWDGYPDLGYRVPIYHGTAEASEAVPGGKTQTKAMALPLRSTKRLQGPTTSSDYEDYHFAGGWPNRWEVWASENPRPRQPLDGE